MKPVFLKEGQYVKSDLNSLRDSSDIQYTKDIYEDQLAELFEVTNPKIAFDKDFDEKKELFIKDKVGKTSALLGNWIYYPWSKTLLHTVNEDDYFLLRTNRNREIISLEEQKVLKNFVVGIAGLSVGGNVANILSYSGFSNTIKLSDFDKLDTTNLNRVRSRLDQVGDEKIEIMARQIYDINPYADLHLFPKGLDDTTIETFFFGQRKVDLIFEIIDDFKVKIKLRLFAKQHKVPVIMLTNLGDNILIDIERYDADVNLKLFNGKIGDIGDDILSGDISKEDEKKYAIDIVGRENLPKRVVNSVMSIGETLVGRPQIASTAQISAGIGVYFTRKIALGENVPSGRTLLKLDSLLEDK